MSAGIEVYDANGNLIFDTGNRLYRILTSLVAGNGGTYTNADLGGLTIAAVAVQQTDSGKRPPTTTHSGNSVTWSFDSSGGGGGSNDTDAILQILVF